MKKVNNNLKNRINLLISTYKRNINENTRRIKMNQITDGVEIKMKLELESDQLRMVIRELQDVLKPKSEK